MDINYVSSIELTEEEKVSMYMKLSKRELISLLINSQKMVNSLLPVNTGSYSIQSPHYSEYPIIWHGINHPITGEPLGTTYKS